jgi:LuxR family transcriptional regulator, maltose regulon positive regulatory protein
MAESRPSTRRGASPDEWDVLLATKFQVPRLRSDLLARPRLVTRLNKLAVRELILISAPVGFGKTTLLADWLRTGGRPVAWLTLDAGDNDPIRFWRCVVGTVDRVCTGLSDLVIPLLDPSQQATPEAVVTAVVNGLTAQPDEFWLILDDYHAVDARPVQDSVAFLVDRLPAHAHLVIATRSDPPLPLARLRARGQLAELRAADLRFTAEEVGTLLREAWGLDLSDDSATALEARTEGWVSALQLAALSLRGTADKARLVQEFTGSNRYVMDFLTEEVLARQPADVQTFLLETSILERLTGTLCDALTGRCNGQQTLEDLERANLFLVPLDDDRRWYRYHHLFADLLRARLRTERPDRVPELHRRAAGWAEEHGLIEDAVRHAGAAGDDVWAVRLVERSVDQVLPRGEGATLRRWLSALPRELVISRPRLCLVEALAVFNAGHPLAAEPLLEAAERGLTSGARLPEESPAGREGGALANVPAAIALLRASLAVSRGDAERGIELVHQAQAQLAEHDHGPRLSCRWNLATADWTRGRLAEAEHAFAELVADGRAAGATHMAVSAGSTLGQVQQAQGRLDAALCTYRQGLELATEPGRPVLLSAGMSHAGIARVRYERNELEDALHHATDGISLCRQLTSTRPLAAALATLAWIRLAHGDAGGARQAIDEAEQVFPSREIVDLHSPAPAERARLLLAQGDVAGAAGWVQEQGLKDLDAPTYARERAYLMLARLWLARHAPVQALDLLDRLRAGAEAQQRMGSVIEIGALQALALDQTGNRARALAAVAEVLALACPEGYLRVFADEGPAMATLVGELIAGRKGGTRHAAVGPVPLDYLGRLLRAFERDRVSRPQTRLPAATLGSTLVLTNRELEVLTLLAAGKPNREIADDLVVTVDTVKKHVTHILDKLGAANRTQAVARARELALIR